MSLRTDEVRGRAMDDRLSHKKTAVEPSRSPSVIVNGEDK